MHGSLSDVVFVVALVGVRLRRLERARLDGADDDDDNDGPLNCDTYGAVDWDYAPIGPGNPRGRTPDDVLADAVDDLNADAVGDGIEPYVPPTGWVELRRDESYSTFVHTPNDRSDDWRFVVDVMGDPALGVWRNVHAVVCEATN